MSISQHIDEIHYGPSTARTVASDIVGGAGTYAVLGARIFSPEPVVARTIHWIVDAGSDFPDSVRKQLESFGTSMHLREDMGRLTTRGYNSYPSDDSAEEHRAFHYLTPKKRLTIEDLHEFGLTRTKSIHLCCSPERCLEEVRKLEKLSGGKADTIIIWEPIPDLCTPEYRESMLEAAKRVNVVSPNHEELSGFFTDGETASLEDLAARISVGPNGEGSVVVRAGRRGCYVHEGSRVKGHWMPPFYEASGCKSHSMVVDPTGGGNTFVGAFAVGLARGKNALTAAAMGAVAASFAIEQIGLPVLDTWANMWNGVDPLERMKTYLLRVGNEEIEV
ncbi:Ribokinase-like protein [Ascodesmis nigricans]|uniref:Ribokinase-like protein n=1 Tax=Ascodesmis nigricans TaxID=341454 RepID=A0A4S2MN53_9PEZI|nr:Ribokinase-like protein [Ascodesmis nigricans]